MQILEICETLKINRTLMKHWIVGQSLVIKIRSCLVGLTTYIQPCSNHPGYSTEVSNSPSDCFKNYTLFGPASAPSVHDLMELIQKCSSASAVIGRILIISTFFLWKPVCTLIHQNHGFRTKPWFLTDNLHKK